MVRQNEQIKKSKPTYGFSSTGTKMTGLHGFLLQSSPTIIEYIQRLATLHSMQPMDITSTPALPPQDPLNPLEKRRITQNYSLNTWQTFTKKLKVP